MSLPTIRQLCTELGPDLVPAAGFASTDAEISAVHISELPDPAGYLNGGELLLTTGLSLPAGRLGCDRYVALLIAGGVSALGFGLGPVHAVTPARLARACREHGLCLLEVPARTPFLAVTQAYWSARSRSTQQQLDDAISAQRAMVGAVVSDQPVAATLRTLALTLGGWAALLDPAGRIEDLHPPTGWSAVEDAAADLRSRGALGPHTASTFPAGPEPGGSGTGGSGTVVVFPLSVGETSYGHLAIGRPERLGPTHRRIALTAGALLTMHVASRRRAQDGTGTLERAILALLDMKLADAARRLSARMHPWALPDRVRVLAWRSQRPDAVRDAVATWVAGAHRAGGAGGRGGESRAAEMLSSSVDAARTWCVVPADVPPLVVLATAVGGADADAAVAVSAATALENVRDVRIRLLEQLAGAPDGTLPRDVAPLPEEDLLRARLARVTGPLPGTSAPVSLPGTPAPVSLPGTPAPAGELTAALAAYLRHRGQWEPAARALGVHRNTLRYRVARVRDLLDLDLTDADVAAGLWLLLRRDGLA